MKVEGIPAKLEVEHNHNVQTHNTIDIQIGARTTQNIVNIIKVAGTVTVTTYAVKKSIDIIERGTYELIMRRVWRR